MSLCTLTGNTKKIPSYFGKFFFLFMFICNNLFSDFFSLSQFGPRSESWT